LPIPGGLFNSCLFRVLFCNSNQTLVWTLPGTNVIKLFVPVIYEHS
jgi:hypothetical protein